MLLRLRVSRDTPYAYEHIVHARVRAVYCLHTPLHVGVSACVGCRMSSTMHPTSLDHRRTPAPTLVVLFYDCLFDSDRGLRVL